ncbi:MAG: NAD(P)-dependent glycerol-3-phosphate dehydrogenase [Sphaerochaetaceae bacterium]|nr:NAD(P)-dependent glycerol-3-phosphate dehydrogenase [Sphaerochaetaceae bacterium]
MINKTKIGVLGAGTWGMALSRMLANEGYEVIVWSAISQEIDDMEKTHRHKNLPGMIIPETIAFTKDIREVCTDKDILLFAVPSVFVRSTTKLASPFICDGQIIVDVAKGIESETLLTMTQIIETVLKEQNSNRHVRLVALSGPTHAEEVAIDMPTDIVASSKDQAAMEYVQSVFMTSRMRVYTNPDILGVELCGAIKNIIALASGVATGLGFGDNTRAAILTRGIAEMKRLGIAMGCTEQTFAGLAGIGDLIVTATSMHSRNNRCGILLGQGKAIDEAVKEVGMVVEGLNAIPAVSTLAKKYHVDMPIVSCAKAVAEGTMKASDAAKILMERPKKAE